MSFLAALAQAAPDPITAFLKTAVDYVWWWPLIILLVGAGLLFTLRFSFIQFRGMWHAISVLKGDWDDPDKEGEITHFQALSSALSATIGLGNIAGVAIAISVGGPGAVFWMWIVALVGMATKFTTCTLSSRFRRVSKDGTVSGGPMIYIEEGLGPNMKWLATLFAFLCVCASFGGGNMFQSNQAAGILNANFGIRPELSGIVLCFLVGMVIIGGIKRIAKVASRIVPAMCVLYMAGALLVMLVNMENIPTMFALIVTDAFGGESVAGATIGVVITQGVRRGVFSNEAGLGSAPIAHAAAKTEEPVREGLVAMLGPFIDTIIVCTMTAFAIISSGAYLGVDPDTITGVALTATAFDSVIVGFGTYFLPIAVLLFSFSTAISWSYYGEKSIEYLGGSDWIPMYRYLFCIAFYVGAVWGLDAVLAFSDITLGLMAVPNLIGTLMLAPVVSKLAKDYFKRLPEMKPTKK